MDELYMMEVEQDNGPLPTMVDLADPPISNGLNPGNII